MQRHKLFYFILSSFAIAYLALSAPEARAQRPGQLQEQLQGCMQREAQAKASNSANDWHAAGESWLAGGAACSIVTSHRDWVKDRINPQNRELSVTVIKRSIACFIRSYDAEGEHDSPAIRERSQALKGLLRSYQTLIRIDPDNASWHYLEGEALTATGLYKQATPELKKAVALGGAGGAKANTLIAHCKPYLAHQLANDQALYKINEQRARENARHPQSSQNYSNKLDTQHILHVLEYNHMHY